VSVLPLVLPAEPLLVEKEIASLEPS